MNKQDLDVIRQRCDKATPGPWECWHKDMDFGGAVKFTIGDAMVIRKSNQRNIGPIFKKEDAEFIANARADISALLAEIDRLKAKLDAIEKLCLKAPGCGISAGKFAVEIAKIIDDGLEGRG